MPVTDFEQPVRQLSGGGRRRRAGIAAWAVAAAVIVVVGIGGRLTEVATVPEAAVPTSAGQPSDPPSVVQRGLLLTEPVEGAPAVTTVAVRVRGRAAGPVDQVELVLLRGDAQLARQTVRPTSSGLFAGLFTLGAPREAGPATVMAIGRDKHGIPVLTVRREVALGALDAVAAIDPPQAPLRLGEDGVLGSRGVDIAALETEAAAARSSRPAGQWPVMIVPRSAL